MALKILRSRTTASEPYRRFRQEVAKHHELSVRGEPGVLPLLAFSVPDTPDEEHPAWMAMPMAIPLEEALGESAQLEGVVQAIAEIAATLARLHAEDVAHRDIKPTNLYSYNDGWAISDFGLVAIPEGESLTVGAKALGPRHFMAPEMLLEPHLADARAADVYSLGKTLWCLLSGQRIPPPGEHRSDLPWKRLSHWGVSHPRAFHLDRLIEQTSAELPNQRPAMAMVADTLRGWSEPALAGSETTKLQVHDLGEEIAAVMAADQRLSDNHKRQLSEVEAVVRQFDSRLQVMAENLRPVAVRLTTEHVGLSDALTGFADSLPSVDRVAAWRALSVERNTGRDRRFAFLRSGFAAALGNDQSVVVGAAHTLHNHKGRAVIWKAASTPTLLGSSNLLREIERIGNEFVRAIPEALEAFASTIRGSDPAGS